MLDGKSGSGRITAYPEMTAIADGLATNHPGWLVSSETSDDERNPLP